MPGEFIHEAKNRCHGTVAMCRRPWRASAVRNIGEEVDELWQEVEPKQVKEGSSVFFFLYLLGVFKVPNEGN